MTSAVRGERAAVEGQEEIHLDRGWQVVSLPPEEDLRPGADGETEWLPAQVPGTAAGALREAGRWHPGDDRDFDAEDWLFRTNFDAEPAIDGEEVTLRFDGIATVSEVCLNGEMILTGESMFARHEVDVGHLLAGSNELTIRCRALTPLLAGRRRPRARWRTRLAAGNLRFFRTMLLGRAPGFAPGPAPVGPWRPVRLIRRRELFVEDLKLDPRVEDDTASLTVSLRARLEGALPGGAEARLEGPSGSFREPLDLKAGADGSFTVRGRMPLPGIATWWPHTHGEPALHRLTLEITGGGPTRTIDCGSIGFRRISAGADGEHLVSEDGLDLHIGGVRVFARGAVWTPIDPVGLAPDPEELRRGLEQIRDLGMNMVRVPGTAAYESDAFLDLCDELGILVWHDFMFANFDYPVADPEFRLSVETEARDQLTRFAARPSVAVLCGGSEIEQQAAMFGADPADAAPLVGELLPAAVEKSGIDAIYASGAPCGGDLPFRPNAGIANYYGVGGYRRPIADARRSEVRFAAECLAFANVPGETALAAMAGEGPAALAVHHPAWKAGVPRDVGTGWDFDDVRDHYLRELFGVDPVELRSVDTERYLELSRTVSGEVMASVFGEWRRTASPCGGGLVLWARDLTLGAGWGLVDALGEPKVAARHLGRALAPVAIWMVDEGLGGVDVHVVNDRPHPLVARVRVDLLRDGEQRLDGATKTIEVGAHGSWNANVETMLGRFVDASYSYRFGPPGHDAIVATLETGDAEPTLLSQAFAFPAGRPLRREGAADLGLEGELQSLGADEWNLRVSSRRLAYGVRIHGIGLDLGDDAFSVEPGGCREIALRSRESEVPDEPALSALNLNGRIRVRLSDGGADS